MSTTDKSQKAAERVLKANNRLARVLAKEDDDKRKRRLGRHLKLGLLVEQFILAGDAVLAKRLEDTALQQFGGRRIDRLDFELDEPLNWFDKIREEAAHRRAARSAPVPDGGLPVKDGGRSASAAPARAPVAGSGALPAPSSGDMGSPPAVSARPS